MSFNRSHPGVLRLRIALMLSVISIGMVACTNQNVDSKDVLTLKKDPNNTYLVEDLADSAKSNSKLPAPSQKMLNKIISGTKRVRIIDCQMDQEGNTKPRGTHTLHEEPISENVLFDSNDPQVLKELSEFLRIREDTFPRAISACAPTMELTLDDGKVIHLGLAGWSTIRCKAWRFDAFLLNPDGFVSWLAAHGVTRPQCQLQAQQEYDKRDEEKVEASLKEFAQTMPTSLRSFFGALHGGPYTGITDVSKKYANIPQSDRMKLARAALSNQFPKERDQIGALLEWSGKITDYKYGFQNFPFTLLMESEPDMVLTKIRENSMTSAQWVGAIRYFSFSELRNKFPGGYKPLDSHLKERLIKEVKATGKNDLDIYNFEQALRYW